MAFDAFISYSSHDKTASDAVCAVLESNGIRCWIAPRDIKPGAEWGASIIDAIENCRVMVLIFSSNANDSRQILREIERAVTKGVPVVPVRIEKVVPTRSMEYFLGAIHWLDALTPPFEAHLGHLAETVRALLKIEGPESGEAAQRRSNVEIVQKFTAAAEATSRPRPSFGLMAGLAAATLAVLIAGGTWLYRSGERHASGVAVPAVGSASVQSAPAAPSGSNNSPPAADSNHPPPPPALPPSRQAANPPPALPPAPPQSPPNKPPIVAAISSPPAVNAPAALNTPPPPPALPPPHQAANPPPAPPQLAPDKPPIVAVSPPPPANNPPAAVNAPPPSPALPPLRQAANPPSAPPPQPAVSPPRLSGIWTANDRGTYVILQNQQSVTWEGRSADDGQTWSHTFTGTIYGDVVDGYFEDHPPGKFHNRGALSVKIIGDNRLEKVAGTGTNFGGSVWSRAEPQLSGTWTANDRGTYVIVQNQQSVTWEGRSADDGQSWSHTFTGTIHGDLIEGFFQDHPPGRNHNRGPLSVRIVDGHRLEKVPGTGTNFGGSVWSR